MKICIRNMLLLIAFLSTEQLYCMNKENKDNITKSERQEIIEKIFADKEMEAIVRNKLRPKILAQERQIEQVSDMLLIKVSVIGAFWVSVVVAASEFLSPIILNIFGGSDKSNK